MGALNLDGPLALDTNCLSYLLGPLDAARRTKMLAATREAAAVGLQFSTLAVAELLVEPAKRGASDRLDELVAVFSRGAPLQPIPVDLQVAELAARIRGRTPRLSLADAVVIGTAVAGDADVLLSNDREVVRVASAYLRAVYFDDWQP